MGVESARRHPADSSPASPASALLSTASVSVGHQHKWQKVCGAEYAGAVTPARSPPRRAPRLTRSTPLPVPPTALRSTPPPATALAFVASAVGSGSVAVAPGRPVASADARGATRHRRPTRETTPTDSSSISGARAPSSKRQCACWAKPRLLRINPRLTPSILPDAHIRRIHWSSGFAAPAARRRWRNTPRWAELGRARDVSPRSRRSRAAPRRASRSGIAAPAVAPSVEAVGPLWRG